MLSAGQLQFFNEQGYVVVEDVFDSDTVMEPLVAEYEEILDGLIDDWTREGLIDELPAGASFQDKIIAAYRGGCDYFQPMDISLPAGEIAPDTPMHAGPAIFRLMTDKALLDIVEQLIGPEITSNPIQHVRLKPPSTMLTGDEIRAHITRTDWHQDRGVTLEEADETRMVTVWCAVTDATVENGCLRVIPGTNKSDMKPHCPLPQVGIPTEFLEEERAVPLPVRSGGVVIFDPLTVHGSLANVSSGVRWSFDLRFNRTGDPTGRPQFPGFVARSRAAPQSELRDSNKWRAMWMEARERLARDGADPIHRWPTDAPYCA